MLGPLPSQIELATLAAMMNHLSTSGQKVQAALDVWNDAGATIQQRERIRDELKERIKLHEDEEANLMDGVSFKGPLVNLNELLVKALPKSKPHDRMATLRRALVGYNPEFPGTAEERITTLRENPAPVEFALYIVKLVRQRQQIERSENLTARAAAGGNAKAARNHLQVENEAETGLSISTEATSRKMPGASSKRGQSSTPKPIRSKGRKQK